MLLPAVEPGFGPFRGRIGGWTAPPCDPGAEAVALRFYLALVTAEALELLGARGPVVAEGPSAGNADYLDMLAAATGRAVIAASGGATGTAVGAALLAGRTSIEAERRVAPRQTAGLCGYLGEWRRRTAAGDAAVERVGTAVEP